MIIQQLLLQMRFPRLLMTGNYGTELRVYVFTPQLWTQEQNVENAKGGKLLHLACRHHISELILGHVFSIHDVSKYPSIEIFTRFKEYRPSIDRAGYCTALEDGSLAAVIAPWKDSVIAFAIFQLKEFKSRDDYRELLELTTIIFFAGISPRGIHFRYPGAVHCARWMARAIYSIKMVLFRSQCNFQKQQEVFRRGSSASYE